MIFVVRLLALLIVAILLFIFGGLYCLLSPRNPRNCYHISKWFGRLSGLFGISLELRFAEGAPREPGASVCIANHQSNWDMVTLSNALMPGAVTVGKKSLLWIPIFGQLYWLTGNVLIDRANRSKAMGTIAQVTEKIREKQLCVWLFPEGTRSRGRGLLPFKTGAFHAAIGAGVPLIPVVCSSTHHLKANRWNNGHVIVEVMAPISPEGYDKDNVRDLAKHCHQVMKSKLEQLDAEVAERNQGVR
ncbi:1-acylglycerol-3-phosphate O-acyltransferase [Salinivibrio sharmensis]|uniref:1-acyl-sn-glycerol-3-phosphate acyltransferase n=1 Tax=Salinivibrio sharmensis TaxID=390883 RepID=A0ABX3KGN4_9GAMM|nr:1-acylglycerol-3-phosphate O-acyltransferase [Salinivibrio sharmensis]OOE88303.1 1-acyl-sn-glycerol-3-phosphate acyltransferase [Salinivibrio sharmensis]